MRNRPNNPIPRALLNLITAFSIIFGGYQDRDISLASAQDVNLDITKSLEKLHKEYEGFANDWRRKRQFCLSLIDDDILKVGAPKSSIQTIFGNDAVFRQADENQVISTMIHFENQFATKPPANQKHIQRAYTGWYLYVELDSDEKVATYFLSNVHKYK